MSSKRGGIQPIILSLALMAAVGSRTFGQTAASRTDRAYQLANERKFLEAATEFKEAIKENPKDIKARTGYATVLLSQNRPEEAADQYRALAEMSPQSPEYRFDLGIALLQARKTEDAIQAFKRAEDLAPYTSRPLLGLANAYTQERRYDDALAAYQRALGYQPEDFTIYQSIAQVYADLERWPEVVRQTQAALRLNPGYRQARLLLISALNSEKDYRRALEESDAALKAAPEDLDLHSARAIGLDGLERRDEAIKEYQGVVKANPNVASVWGNLGWTQYGAGKYADAIASSRKALELDAKLAYVRFNLGLIYAVQGDSANSRKEYEAAVAVAEPADLRAGIEDVKDALKKQPNSEALKAALTYLQAAKPGRNG
jgi:tetratricopeptide (TPR) repeat protein